jgi:hypothetical protein
VDPHCFDADPEPDPDPAQNLDAAAPDPDPDRGGGGQGVGQPKMCCASPLAKSWVRPWLQALLQLRRPL